MIKTRWPGIRRIFRFERDDVVHGVRDELRFHFALKVEELMRQGLSPEQARVEAERLFGDVQATSRRLAAIDREHVWRLRIGEWLDDVRQDVRYALRVLRKQPGFAVAVIGILGLGIGANVTMFGVVDRMLFRPPAYLARPAEVNRIYLASMESGAEQITESMAYRRYRDLAVGTGTVANAAAAYDKTVAIGIGEQVVPLPVEEVSASFWSLFDARPAAGRFFRPDEDEPPSGAAVVVLGYRYWQSAYAGAEVIGRAIHVGPQAYTIIGVAPRGFAGIASNEPALFMPITNGPGEVGGFTIQYLDAYNTSWMTMVIRRKAGVSAEQAANDLTAAYRRSYAAQRVTQPSLAPVEIARPRVLAAPLLSERGPTQSQDARVATWLIAVAAMVLIIACANVANLLLVRALSRRREIAMRLALGISRGRLLRQLLAESLLLAVLASAVGFCLAHWGGGIVRRLLLPGSEPVSAWTDGRLLLFTLAVTLVAGVGTGIVPAFQATRGDIVPALKAGTREWYQGRSALRAALLVLQASLSLVLLVGAALFVRSLQHATTMRLGYDVDRVLWVAVRLRGTQLSDVEARELKYRMIAAARALPEVEQATRMASVPFTLSFGNNLYVTGRDSVNAHGEFHNQSVSADYFRTMGTAILRGRPLTEAEANDSIVHAMVISQSMAQRLWPKADALGRCIRVYADTMPCATVVGIAEDIRTASLIDDAALTYYVPIGHTGNGGLFVRTRGDAAAHAVAVKRVLQRLMPGMAYVTVEPFAEIIRAQSASWRLGATMFTVFGGLALAVAALGLYSVVAYGVTQRRHEMGVRAALGAGRGNILRLVLGQALRLVAGGVVLGLAVSWVAGRWMQPLLLGTSSRDPLALIGCSALMLVVAGAASAGPALRATRADPTVALRMD